MSPSPSSATRKKQHKKGFSPEEAKCKREEEVVRIRDEKISEIFKKRRNTPPLRRLEPEFEHLLSDDSSRHLAATAVIRKFLSTGGSPVINVVVGAGVVPRLVEFLNKGTSPLLQNEAAWALANIASGTSDHIRRIIQLGCILKFKQLLDSSFADDSSGSLAAITVIRKLLSTGKSPVIDEVVGAGVVPQLVKFLDAGAFPLLQTEAAWALANIASGTSDHVQLIDQLGSIPKFVQLLHSPFADAREQAVWALANIAVDSPNCRDRVLSAGALVPLLTQLDGQPELTLMRSIAWTLSNLYRWKPLPPFEQVKPALPVLGSLINSGDEEVLIHACSALSIISDCSSDNIQFVIGAGVCPRLLELLVHASPKVQVPTLKTVGNIVSGTDAQTQFVIDNQGLPPLCQILTGNWDESIKEEACWVIANITAGNSNQIQAVIEANIIPPLVSLLQHDEFKINKEAARAISYLISGGSDKQIQHLVHQGCIKLLCDLLTCSDPDIISLCLDGLESILESGEGNKELGIYQVNKYLCMIKECDGFNKIAGLQTDMNNEVNKQASGILAKYWNKKENEEEESNSIDSGADMEVKFKELSLS